MKLIVGLWNPGTEYHTTRHNAGFLVADELRALWGMSEFESSDHRWLIARGEYQGQKVLILKPLTYMNLSGESVGSLMRYYKIDISDLLVISDDIDMDFGKVRYRLGGSSGGQNGLKSITAHIGTQEFARIKIGIGRHTHMSVSDWVLSRLSADELESLRTEIFDQVRDKIEAWMQK